VKWIVRIEKGLSASSIASLVAPALPRLSEKALPSPIVVPRDGWIYQRKDIQQKK
jgi:hypothetical protein